MAEKQKKPNGWDEWKNFVLDRLDAHGDDLKAIKKEIADTKVEVISEITSLKVKSGVWGAIGGLIPVILALGLAFVVFLLRGI